MRHRVRRGPALIALVAIGLMLGQVGAAAPLGAWHLIGPPGGSARALVTDPRHPATIYAGGRNGISLSLDAGQSWTPINNGLTHRGVISIAIDPSDASRLYVGTDGGGLFKSDDGGGPWLDTNQGLRPVGQRWRAMSVWSIAVHPKRSKTILIGVERGPLSKRRWRKQLDARSRSKHRRGRMGTQGLATLRLGSGGTQK